MPQRHELSYIWATWAAPLADRRELLRVDHLVQSPLLRLGQATLLAHLENPFTGRKTSTI